jgi:4-methylaminobutanoate oxidase (formaldehyde-forming)
MRDLAWLRSLAAAGNESVGVADLSSGYTTLAVMGPRSRELLSRISPADFSDERFPFGTAQEIEIGYALTLAFRMTFVGELGWELHVATEHALSVYDHIVGSGSEFGLRHAGYVALNTLRLEAGYRDWGADVSDEDTPLQAGLGFTVAWDKNSDFIGRRALQQQSC